MQLRGSLSIVELLENGKRYLLHAQIWISDTQLLLNAVITNHISNSFPFIVAALGMTVHSVAFNSIFFSRDHDKFLTIDICDVMRVIKNLKNEIFVSRAEILCKCRRKKNLCKNSNINVAIGNFSNYVRRNCRRLIVEGILITQITVSAS